MPMENVHSVLAHGILSHDRAAALEHRSVAMEEMQDRRRPKSVPGGLRLHQYANLYFHARNPMLFKRRAEAVCVLRISTMALQVAGAVITDQNAASDYVRFFHPSQWQMLNFDDIYAREWTHSEDDIRGYQHKSRKCAEVLVPHCIEPRLLIGAYVPDMPARDRVLSAGFQLEVNINPDFFFR